MNTEVEGAGIFESNTQREDEKANKLVRAGREKQTGLGDYQGLLHALKSQHLGLPSSSATLSTVC